MKKPLSDLLNILEYSPDLIKLSDFAYLTVFEKRRLRALANQRGIKRLPRILYLENIDKQKHLSDAINEQFGTITKVLIKENGKVIHIKEKRKP